tara:strand:+ start:3837 stop:5651 length:1815 start_codon:yes stop_codon:yes gene_type:complete
MNFIISFFYNLTILNYLFFLLEQIDNARILEYSYVNLAEDLNFIGAQFNVNFTYFIFSIPISLIVSFIINRFVRFDFENDAIETLLKKFLYIGFINLAILCFFIFFLRLYELLSRAYVFFYILLFPFFYLFFDGIQYVSRRRLKKNIYNVFVFVIVGGLIFLNTNFYSSSLENILNRDKVEQDIKIISQEKIESLDFQESIVLDDEECAPWKGTGQFTGCIGGIKISSSSYEQQVTNLTVFNNKLYIVFKDGTVYVQESLNSELKLFLDLTDIVYTEFPGMSQGLYDIAFESSGKSFLVSYSNSDIAIVFSKYFIKDDGTPDYENPQELLRLSNNVKYHFGGSIVWSEFFDGYLVGIGDMRENIMPLVHSDALNTTSYKGKIILLDSDKTISSPLINEHGLYESIDKIVAYGLRNPWQITEYKNRLIITDVGSQFIEEVNDVNYLDYEEGNFTSVSFGWPLMMGDELSYNFRERNKDAMTKLDGKITDLYYWESDVIEKADDYLIENSKSPLLQYDHFVDENTIRAAIIGGDFIRNGSGKYDDYYFFTDYVESEIYGVNIETKDLLIFPVTFVGNPTSLKGSPFQKDTLVIGYANGIISSVELP